MGILVLYWPHLSPLSLGNIFYDKPVESSRRFIVSPKHPKPKSIGEKLHSVSKCSFSWLSSAWVKVCGFGNGAVAVGTVFIGRQSSHPAHSAVQGSSMELVNPIWDPPGDLEEKDLWLVLSLGVPLTLNKYSFVFLFPVILAFFRIVVF